MKIWKIFENLKNIWNPPGSTSCWFDKSVFWRQRVAGLGEHHYHYCQYQLLLALLIIIVIIYDKSYYSYFDTLVSITNVSKSPRKSISCTLVPSLGVEASINKYFYLLFWLKACFRLIWTWRRESTNITDSLVFFIQFWLEACFRLIPPGPSLLREWPTLFTHFSKFREVTHNFLRLKYHNVEISTILKSPEIETSQYLNHTILKSPQYWNLHNIEISTILKWNLLRLKSPQYWNLTTLKYREIKISAICCHFQLSHLSGLLGDLSHASENPAI